MSKGSYNVENGKVSSSSANDSSYRSCLCAMLIFITLCIVIILASIKWNKSEEKPKEEFETIGAIGASKNEHIQMATTEHTTNPTGTTKKRTTTPSPTNFIPIVTTSLFTTVTPSKINEVIVQNKTDATKASINLTTTQRTKKIPSKTDKIDLENVQTTIDYDTTEPYVANTIIFTKKLATSKHQISQNKANQDESEETTQNFTTENWSSTEQLLTSIDGKQGGIQKTANVTESSLSTTEIILNVLEKTETTTNATEKTINAIEKTTKSTEKKSNVTEIILKATEKAATITENPLITEDDLFGSDSTTPDDSLTSSEEMILFANTLIPKVVNETTSESKNSTKSSSKRVESTEITPDTSEDNLEGTTRIGETVTENALVSNNKSQNNNNNSTTVAEDGFITMFKRKKSAKASTNNKTQLYKAESTEKFVLRTTTAKSITKEIILPMKRLPVCKRSGCEIESTRILNHMNHSANICDNFYEFACGGTRLDYNPDEDHHYEKLIRLINKINDNDQSYLVKYKKFYDSCMVYTEEFNYEERINNIKRILNSTGEMHLKNVQHSIDLTELFAKLLLAGSLPIFDIDTVIDKQSSKILLKMTMSDETSNIINVPNWKSFWRGEKRCLNMQIDKINEPSLNLDKIHDDYVACQRNYSIYVKSIGRICKELGYFADLPYAFNVTQKEGYITTGVEWDILQNLQEMPNQNEIHKTLHEMDYYITKLGDLNQHFKLIDWKRFFHIITGLDLDDGTTVQVYFHKQFHKLFTTLNKVKKEDLNNFLLAMYANDLYQYTMTQYSTNDRSKYCVKLTSNLFKDVTAKIYSETYTKEYCAHFRKLIKEIFKKIRGMFEVSLSSVTWISEDDDKPQFLMKLKQLHLLFHNDVNLYLKDLFLNSKYENFNIDKNSFQTNLLEVLTKQRKWYYGFVKKEFTDDMLFAYYLMPYDQEPVTYYSSNIIGIPMGMMKLHYNDLPIDYLQVKIGIHLARTIAKHFDNVGIAYKISLGEDISRTYEDMIRTMGLIDGEKLSTSKKLGNRWINYVANEKFAIAEKIADNTAFNMTIESLYASNVTELLPWVSFSYSSDQLHFIGLAQEFCKKTDILQFMKEVLDLDELPASLRVDNMMKNSYRFNQIFNCSITDSNPKFQFPHLELAQQEDYGDRSN